MASELAATMRHERAVKEIDFYTGQRLVGINFF